MSEEFEQLFLELKKLPKGTEGTLDYLKHLLRLFVADFEASMSKRLDIKYWSRVKRLLDEMRTASDDDKLVVVNTQSLATGFWSDLGLLVHVHYRMPRCGLPAHLTIDDDAIEEDVVPERRREVKSSKCARVFLAYFMLRMGDLVRYKGQMEQAREHYQLSSQINPADGAVWNQLGICASSSAKWVDAVYFHTRALHAALDFSAASASLTAIFKKFANRDTSKNMVIGEKLVVCLAKIHFLMEIENGDEVLEELGKNTKYSKQLIISLLSIFSNLEGDTDLENRSIGYVKTVWKSLNRNILERILNDDDDDDDKSASDEHLHLLALLHNGFRDIVTTSSEESLVTNVIEKVVKTSRDDVISDSNRFAYFNYSNQLKYPLKRADLVGILRESHDENDEEDVEEEEEDSEDDVDSDSDEKQTRVTTRRHSKFDSDSEEEILRGGARRGRQNANKSIDTDDEEFWNL